MGGPGAPADSAGSWDRSGERGRFSARRKVDAILRVLRGESLDAVSRELGVTAATLGQWRESFLAAGQAGLKSRLSEAQEEEFRRLRETIGAITMENEILLQRARRAEGRDPFAPRRSSP